MPLPGFGQASLYLRDACELHGPDFLFNTACTASANALLAAADWIASGRSEQALVVGVELRNVTTLSGFAGMQLLAADVMRPFDARRDGLVLGEGCGAIVLRADSPWRWRRRRRVRCRRRKQLRHVQHLYVQSGWHAHRCGHARRIIAGRSFGRGHPIAIKAHGTASPLNDDAEAAGMVPGVF